MLCNAHPFCWIASLYNSGVEIKYLDQTAEPVWPLEAPLSKNEINEANKEKQNKVELTHMVVLNLTLTNFNLIGEKRDINKTDEERKPKAAKKK